jgi:hypothetical protein
MAAPVLFCTYFDSNFAVRGLAMIRSLARHRSAPWKMVVLCLDQAAEAILARMRRHDPALALVERLPLSAFEAKNPDLLAVKLGRSKVEYFFTCTPVLCRWLLSARPDVERLIYLDADLWFFSNDESLFEEMGDAPVAVIEHRFPDDKLDFSRLNGRFNVAWNAFDRSPAALACLDRWRSQCLEWCGDESSNGRFGDQKYLDDWPEQVPGLVIISNPGADLAPWNLGRHRVRAGRGGVPEVDGRPLVFYHFHALGKWGGPGDYIAMFDVWGRVPAPVIPLVYEPYLRELMAIENEVTEHARELLPGTAGHLIRERRPKSGIPALRRRLYEYLCMLRGLRVRFRRGHSDLLWRVLNPGAAP